MSTTKFARSDLELFSAASYDRNPLHLLDEYARKTAYGERVVFGMLGVLAGLGQLSDRPTKALSGIRIQFRQPVFIGVDYRVETEETSADRCRVKIYDAERLMTTATLTFRLASQDSMQPIDYQVAHRTEPADQHLEEIGEGRSVSGVYAPAAPYFGELIERWGVSRKGVAADQLAALLWSSYLVGMELPGKRALFWSMVMSFDPDRRECRGPLAYQATAVRSDHQLDFVEVVAELTCGGASFATATIRAFVRRDSPMASPQMLETILPRSERLRGKVALVVGGSRGLGSAIVQALAMQGCTVLATYRRSTEEAARVQKSLLSMPGSVEMVQGDAADETWYRDVLCAKVANHGGLDILVCNAAPPIRPLGLSLEEMERFQAFIDTSLALVSVPMAAFLGSLSERLGWVVLISSSMVISLPTEWPHYVAAKCAAEGLVHWAAARYKQSRFLVARPPRLLTEQTNTPGGRQGAMAVEEVAAVIVRRLYDAQNGEVVELLETF